MSYRILSERSEFSAREEETIFTMVEYDIDGTIIEVEVAHFMPQSRADIILGIENREVSEKVKLSVS
jgi:hypothetical protein